MTTGTLQFAAPDIAEYIREHCYGQANAMTYRQLSDALGMRERDFRDAVKVLCHERHVPIVSDCVHGYWWATSDRECRQYRHAMWRRGIACIRAGRDALPAEIDLAGQRHCFQGG